MSAVGEGSTLAMSGPVSAPDELGAARALNNEYLKKHPEEVARFLDGRGPAETASLIALAPAHVAAQILERLNPRMAAEAVGRLSLEAARGVIAAMNPARAAPIVVSMASNQRDALLMRLDARISNEIREMLSYP
ncbi:MAG TPA: hypothetical protein VM052_01790, partial [Candidatus Limnocylindrales bacterium]|nr:hypothetical protein [Candidatus Limnocylindrales bacterium]